MSKVVLNASALLCLIKNEPGAEIIEALLGHEHILMSSVNVAEVASILLDLDISTAPAQEAIEPFIDSIVPFYLEQVMMSASLKKMTKHLGLSLGDRSCIALGTSLDAPIYTADRIWKELTLEKSKIILIC